MVTLDIIDPREIAKRRDIIDELKEFGIDHTTHLLTSGWNYVIDHVWLASRVEKVIKKDTVILDVGCGASPFHNYLEKKYHVNIIGIDRPSGYSHQPRHENVDIESDFLDVQIKPHSVSLIMWLSSIEHNQTDVIKKLWRKSVHFLKPGGVILATIPIAPESIWFYPSEQMNLSVKDAVKIFGVDTVEGDYDTAREGYMANVLHLHDKMFERYKYEPKFVIAGIEKN